MAAPDTPQICLISPPALEVAAFSPALGRILDQTEVACFRLSLASDDEDQVARIADAIRETCHARDVAIVIDRHFRLVERLGLDGCHLSDGARQVRDVRADLGSDAIVGSYCATSRHTGMSAAEAGADYVSFGPLSASALGDGDIAPSDLFEWWSDVIEVPIVAEGNLTPDVIRAFSPITDFFAIGPEIWRAETPHDALTSLLKNIG